MVLCKTCGRPLGMPSSRYARCEPVVVLARDALNPTPYLRSRRVRQHGLRLGAVPDKRRVFVCAGGYGPTCNTPVWKSPVLLLDGRVLVYKTSALVK